MKVPKMKDFLVEEDKIIFIFDEIIKPKEGVRNGDLMRLAMKEIDKFCGGYNGRDPRIASLVNKGEKIATVLKK